MHFFYVDEAGCTGNDLCNAEQPIFVMGGVSIRDEGWNETQARFSETISEYFNGHIPNGFELHGSQLLSPNGEGPFENDPIEKRLDLARRIFDLLEDRSHSVHLFAIKKASMAETDCRAVLPYEPRTPYLCAFDYLITYINDHVRNKLGRSARGMVLMDKKEQFHDEIERITYHRRYEGAAAHRVKWVVEFSYPIDSRKNPMIQLSDLIVLCTRRFMEVEHGYRDSWPGEVKRFYAECYAKMHERIAKKQLVKRGGRGMEHLNTYLASIRCEPVGQWRRRYGLN